MPDPQRLDMAIKYSAEPYSNNLLEVSEMALCVAYLVWLSFVRNLQNCSLLPCLGYKKEKITSRVHAFLSLLFLSSINSLSLSYQQILLTVLQTWKLFTN